MGEALPGQLIGRTAELARIDELLASGARLITLWGTAGLGKTRLAREFVERSSAAPGSSREPSTSRAPSTARESGTSRPATSPRPSNAPGASATPSAPPISFRFRCWMSELAACADEDQACSIVASTLGLDASMDPSRDRIGRWLSRAGASLLILDNLEQLGERAAALVDAWLSQAPDLRILATSRTRLRLDREIAVELPPLSLIYTEDPAGSEAALLLLAKTRAVLPGFVPTASQARLVAEIVESLEGIPLAIELAAARVDVLGLEGLRRRLPARLDVLAERRPGRTARQATLRGAIAWSWDLLDAAEKSALAQCAVFRGGFTLEAAERVVRIDADVAQANRRDAHDAARREAREARGVLDLIEALRDRSMLRRVQGAAGQDSPRFVMFESIAAFASEKLDEAGLRPETEARFVAWTGELARPWIGEGGRAGASISALLPERENLLAAATIALESGGESLQHARTILLASDLMLATRGPAIAHLELLQRAVASMDTLAPGGAPVVDLLLDARVRGAMSRALTARGRHDEAIAESCRAIGTARLSGDPHLVASSLVDLGVAHHQRRELVEARARYEEARIQLASSVPRARDHDARASALAALRIEARALGNLGAIHHDAGEFAPAAELYRRALACFRDVGDTRLEGIFRTNLGVLAHEQLSLSEARDHFASALSLLERAADGRCIAITCGNLGALEHELGGLDAARVHHEHALAIFDRLGDVRSEALCRGRLSAVLSAMMHLDEASAQLEAGELLLRGSGDRVALVTLRVYGAFLRIAQARRAKVQGESERASRELADARAAVAEATRSDPTGERSVAQVSDDVRTALRILAPMLTEGPTSRPSFSTSALVVESTGLWFRAPGGAWHDLRQRMVIRAVLITLVDRHRKGATDLDTLREAAWPGEHIESGAAANRVHVALADLRKRGLKGVLLRSGTGYLLDPTLEIQRVAASWAEVQG